jgi:enoyl-CoA hydratase/carnithine racemase
MAQIAVDKPSSGRWTATFSNPPINLIDPDTIGELQHLIAALESDPDVKVVVFRSADPDFFLALAKKLGAENCASTQRLWYRISNDHDLKSQLNSFV